MERAHAALVDRATAIQSGVSPVPRQPPHATTIRQSGRLRESAHQGVTTEKLASTAPSA
jgi:hypothetical protein